MSKLLGKVALVTGSGRGIGRSIALKLASEGAKVVVNDLDPAPAEETVAAIRTAGGLAVACAGSVTDAGFPDRFVKTALDEFGGIDIIVNNAGYTWDNVIQKMTDEQWDAILDARPYAEPRSAPVPRRVAVEDAFQGFEVFAGLVDGIGIGVHGPNHLGDHPLRDRAERPAGGHGEDLHHAGPLQEVQVVPGRVNRGSGHDHAVVSQKQHRSAPQHLGHPVALGVVECQPLIIVEVCHPAVELEGILGHHLEAAPLDDGERRGVGHVGVEHGLGARVVPVEPGVNEEGGVLDHVGPLEDPPVAVRENEVAGRQFTPMKPERIDQELVTG